jgi:hypothetical protein
MKTLKILAVLPIVPCALLSLLYDKSNPYSGADVLWLGVLLVCCFCPLYYMVLCGWHVIKKELPVSDCVKTCLMNNTLTNAVLIVMIGILSEQPIFTWMILFYVISMSATAFLLWGVHSLNKWIVQRRKQREKAEKKMKKRSGEK